MAEEISEVEEFEWTEVTAFIRRQAASWGEMEDYLVDSGAVLTWIATK